MAPAPPRDDRLRDDVGAWTPSDAQIERALRLRDREDRETALADLDPDARIDTLRTGLRLRDDAAAIACAARLEYRDMDNWECARAVELLMPTFLFEESEAQFDEFRAYIGSVELPKFLETLPPLPWCFGTTTVLGQMHRVMRGEHIPLYIELARSSDPTLAGVAQSQFELLQIWNDTHRREAAVFYLGLSPRAAVPEPGGGIDPLLVALLRKWYVDVPAESRAIELKKRVAHWVLRWLRDASPAPSDEPFLIDLATAGRGNETPVGVAATILLGLVDGADSDAYLRRRNSAGDDNSARRALARRGDESALAEVESDARKRPADLALLLECDPPRARRLIDRAVFGPDPKLAADVFDALARIVDPAAYKDFHGFRWDRSAFDGIEKAALESDIDALRLAWIGAVVPGCRTRAVAEAAAARIDDRFFPEDEPDEGPEPPLLLRWEPLVFMEVGAPEAFRQALRRVARETESEVSRGGALSTLLTIGDPEPSPELIEFAKTQFKDVTWTDGFVAVARNGGPEIKAWLESELRRAAEASEAQSTALAALATFHGLHPAVSEGGVWGDFAPADGVLEAMIDGRPVDALVLQLDAHPDEFMFDVGLVDDPRIAAYLQTFRDRRSLDLYWHATGELAAMGDAEAREDFWGAMKDGRYRIMNDVWVSSRTLGFDLRATVPFWIDELRSQCCRIVTGGEGDIFEDLFGIDCYATEFRTSYDRVLALWNAANGDFVWSYIADHYVPAVR